MNLFSHFTVNASLRYPRLVHTFVLANWQWFRAGLTCFPVEVLLTCYGIVEYRTQRIKCVAQIYKFTLINCVIVLISTTVFRQTNGLSHQRLENTPSPTPEVPFEMCNCTGFSQNVQVQVECTFRCSFPN